MYLRTTQRQNKDGSVVRYVALAHNQRNDRGQAVAKVIHSFGREDQIDRKALERLVASISRFLSPEAELRAKSPGFEFLCARQVGGPHVLDGLWQELGISKTLVRLARKRRFRGAVERLIFAMVAQRALEPASKLEATRWATEDVKIPGLSDVDDDSLYRAMDFLIECADQIQESVYYSVINLLNLEVDVVFFDTTSTYFETEEEDPDIVGQGGEVEDLGLRRFGHSKDHRKDRPQAVIGLAVTREGIPVRVWVWPGMSADQSLVKEIKDDLRGLNLGRLVYVCDTGFASKENLRYLQRAGGHYIAGKKMRSGEKEVEEALGRPGRYRKVADSLEVKEVKVGEGDSMTRYVVCLNPKEQVRDQDRRHETLAKLGEELGLLGDLDGKAHTKRACELRSHPTLGRYLRQTKDGALKVDADKVKAEERLDGKYLLITSDHALPADEVALGYKNLLQAERSFRDLKGVLKLRPVYHRRSDRIRSHVMVCFLALVVIRVAETRAGTTWRRIRNEVSQIQMGRFRTRDGEFEQRTELTAAQRALLRSLGATEPPKFGDIQPD